ncbi:MAG: hypothetical protein DIZ80_10040 [endosymbiont of Galathealinum brachiosum]|uniref:DUF484 domain-containing protein n=1 Tax=endosymbiont of Galathealinum brachiosum TaxID=2200906 RepID=A0A370DE05_9GAMM|nr:MAG: hypothetical protein DIZ80_10040 [endosymbiont of Galathealinum brachiosum]
MTNQLNNQAEKTEELELPEEQQVVDYLMENPDFFLQHSPLLSDLEIPHESGVAVSLVERQVSVLREKNQHFEEKLRDMVDAVHDNQRLHVSLHRLAVNLFDADSLDDILGVVDDELRHKLGTDFVYFRLHSEDIASGGDEGHTYVDSGDEVLQAFSVLIEKNRIQCGHFTQEEIASLFFDDADDVASAALIPVSVPGIQGLIILGSCDEQRYHAGMGTDFLSSLSDLIGAAMRSQLLKAVTN